MSGFKFSTGQHTIESPDGPTVINIQPTGKQERVMIPYLDGCELRHRFEDAPLYTMEVNGDNSDIPWTEAQICSMARQFALPYQAIFLPGNVGLL